MATINCLVKKDLLDVYQADVETDHDVHEYCPVGVLVTEADGQFLFLQSAEGEWGMPGGRIAEGEDLVIGLLRNVQSQTGISRFAVTVRKFCLTSQLPTQSRPHGYLLGEHDYYFHGVCLGRPTLKYDAKEFVAARWLVPSAAYGLLNSLPDKGSRRVREMRFAFEQALAA
jgi:ADP-ribose pyrophosphatase YjhB (NUDIX family)